MNAAQAVERGLLEQYAPILRFHPQEPYRADSPATMTNAAFEGRRGTRLAEAAGGLRASALALPGLDLLHLDYLGATYPDGPAASPKDRLVPNRGTWEADAREMHARPLLGDRCYARAVQQDGGRVWLQYWLFYSFNDKGIRHLGDHEGDWEMIQIGLDGGGRPELATFAQHKGGERRGWSDVRTLDDEPDAPPIVFVALGSHACYFQPGNYLLRPLPVFDHAVDGIEVRPAVERLRGRRWEEWPGRWGGDGAPQGPRLHTQWSSPDTWHAGKRVHGRRRARIGRIFLAADDAVAPPEALTATQSGDRVTIGWRLGALDPADPHVPVRILVSVRRDGGTDPPLVRSLDLAEPEGSETLAAPAGEGALVAGATAFDAADLASVPIETPVAVATPARGARPRRGARAVAVAPVGPAAERPVPARAGNTVRWLVRAADPDPATVGDLRAAVDEQLGVDAAGAPWRVAPLFASLGGGVAERLDRYVAITGRLPDTSAYPLAAAMFDVAQRLAEATGLEVHPDLPSSALVNGRPRDRRVRAARARIAAPVDPGWPLRALRVEDAWRTEPGRGAGVRIAQPDTGVTLHPALATPSLDRAHQVDVLDGDDDATDPLERRWWRLIENPGHGTATASVIVGAGPGAPRGAAPGATLIPIRCITGVVQVLDGDVALAIEAARRLGVDVITMSIGGEGFLPVMRDAIAAAVADGIIVLAAGGNYAPFVPAPARLPECLAVAATDEHDGPWEWSSPGKEIDWAAPGENVPVASARREGGSIVYGVRNGDGSSFAVAHTAAVAALWVARHGRAALRRRYPGAVQWAFQRAVYGTIRRPPGWGDVYGEGILDAAALLRSPLPSTDEARPSARRARPAAAGPEGRLAPLLPELSAHELRQRLSGLLDTSEAELDAVLARHGGELAHHLTEDRPLRDAVAAGRLDDARDRLATSVSDGLLERLAR